MAFQYVIVKNSGRGRGYLPTIMPEASYICGLNTLLDKKPIPWKKGLNKYYITYPMGLLLLGGKYYFDTAIEDKTASVPIHYIKAAREVMIETPYLSEGIFTIPHDWSDSDGEV